MRLNKFTITKIGMGLAALAGAGVIALGVTACGSSDSTTTKNTAEITKSINMAKSLADKNKTNIEKIINLETNPDNPMQAATLLNEYIGILTTRTNFLTDKNFQTEQAKLLTSGIAYIWNYKKKEVFNGYVISGVKQNSFDGKKINDTGTIDITLTLQYAKVDSKGKITTKYTKETLLKATTKYKVVSE